MFLYLDRDFSLLGKEPVDSQRLLFHSDFFSEIPVIDEPTEIWSNIPNASTSSPSFAGRCFSKQLQWYNLIIYMLIDTYNSK